MPWSDGFTQNLRLPSLRYPMVRERGMTSLHTESICEKRYEPMDHNKRALKKTSFGNSFVIGNRSLD